MSDQSLAFICFLTLTISLVWSYKLITSPEANPQLSQDDLEPCPNSPIIFAVTQLKENIKEWKTNIRHNSFEFTSPDKLVLISYESCPFKFLVMVHKNPGDNGVIVRLTPAEEKYAVRIIREICLDIQDDLSKKWKQSQLIEQQTARTQIEQSLNTSKYAIKQKMKETFN